MAQNSEDAVSHTVKMSSLRIVYVCACRIIANSGIAVLRRYIHFEFIICNL